MMDIEAGLVDSRGARIAKMQVADIGDRYSGTIDLSSTPTALLDLFREFSECVNGQMFDFLDEIDDRIDSYHLSVRWQDGQSMPLKNLQVFPETGTVSFEVVAVAVEQS